VVRTLKRMVANAVEREAAARSLAAHRIHGRRAPVVGHVEGAPAHLHLQKQLQPATLLLKLQVVVAVARAGQHGAVLIVACTAARQTQVRMITTDQAAGHNNQRFTVSAQTGECNISDQEALMGSGGSLAPARAQPALARKRAAG